jgi:sulfite reductase alpha subunit-like flavoprotein
MCLYSGDALGIFPQNSVEVIKQLLAIVDWKGSETVNIPSWAYNPKPGCLSVDADQAFFVAETL